MGFWNQLYYLLWKNLLLRRRKKVRLIIEILWPLILFAILVWARTIAKKEKRDYCTYTARAMPGSGFIPFLQSYFCTFGNPCSQIPLPDGDIGVLGHKDQSLLGRSLRLFESIFSSSTDLVNMKESFSRLTHLTRMYASPSRGGTLADVFPVPRERMFLASLFMASNVSKQSVDTLLNVPLKPDFFQIMWEIAQLKPDNPWDNVRRRIFCNKKALPLEDFCKNWNTTAFGGLLTISRRTSSQEVLERIVGGQIHLERIRHPVNNVTNLLKEMQNSTLTLDSFMCGSYSHNWAEVFKSEKTFKRSKKKPKSLEEDSASPISSTDDEEETNKTLMTEILEGHGNETDLIACGGVKLSTDLMGGCFNLLRRMKVPNGLLTRVFPLLQGFILVSPMNAPIVQKNITEELNVFLKAFQIIQESLMNVHSKAEMYQDAVQRSEFGKGIDKLKRQMEKLNARGAFSRSPKDSKDHLDSLTAFLEGYKNLMANSSTPSSAMGKVLQMLGPLIQYLKCFRTERVILVDSESGMEVLGMCLIDKLLYYSGIVIQVSETAQTLAPLVKYKIRMTNDYIAGPGVMERIWNPRPYDRPFEDLQFLYFGFSFLQDVIERAILKIHSQQPPKLGIYAQEFPNPCHSIDVFQIILAGLAPLFMILSWVFTAAITVKSIVYEKEARLKEVMKVMGLSNLVHWVAWFITSLCVLMISILLLTMMLKLGNVIAATDVSVLFLFLTLYAMATITQCFLISTLFSRANLAAACGAIIYFLLYIPYMMLYGDQETLSLSAKTASCLLSQVAFGWGSSLLASWEQEGTGLQWKNIAKSPAIFEEFSFLIVILMLLADSAIHLILTWYIEAVYPGEFGIPRPWYFPVLKTYWCGNSSGLVEERGAEEIVGGPDPDKLEAQPEHLQVGVSIRNLRKVYANGKVAVDGLSLDFCQNQITSFLGHNGAGKTTTMSILTGLYHPTDGRVMIHGRDIRKDFDEIRKSVGMCPQHNVLFDYLTVKEQMTFYAGLKGVSRKEMKKEVEESMDAVDLKTKSSELAKNLSGGMQRKLSIAVAFIGGSKTVILDEPTAGVDPYARRGIWDLLTGNKEGRTIILSTHHMDEADILGDRIAIISKGKLQCCGSSIFLKKKFGSGFHLTLVKDLPEGHTQKKSRKKVSSSSGDSRERKNRMLLEFVKQRVEGAHLREDFGTELAISLPTSDPKILESLFQDLEEKQKSLGVAAYGMSDTTLEEVFLHIVGEEREENAKAKTYCDCCPKVRERLRGGFSRTSKEEAKDSAALDETLSVSETQSSDEESESEDEVHPRISIGNHGWIWLTQRRLRGLLVKRFHSSRKNVKGALAEIILPVILVTFTMILVKIQEREPENPPPLLITPWLYGTEEYPNVMFYSSDIVRKGGNKRSQKMLESLLEPPGVGVRCMNKNPVGEDYECVRTAEEWEGVLFRGNYSISGYNCYCDKESEYVCPTDVYKPVPPRMTLNTTDIMVNMTGRNISQWIFLTEKKYRKQRFGGFSLGEVNERSLKKGKFFKVLEETEGFFSFLSNLSANLKIDWNPGVERNDSISQRLSLIFSGMDIQDNIKVWFNNQGWMAIPAYMNTVSNAVLRYLVSKKGEDPRDYGIIIYSHAMNRSKGQQIRNIERKIQEQMSRDSFQIIMILLAFSMIPASFLFFVIDERISRSKHLQFVSGVGPILYWASNFIWDMMNFMIPVILCMILFFSFDLKGLIGSSMSGLAIFLLLTAYGFAIIPLMYPFSFLFEIPSLAVVSLAIGNFFLGTVTTLTTFTFDILQEEQYTKINKVLKKVFLFFPQFCLGRGVFNLKKSHTIYLVKKEYLGASSTAYNPFTWNDIGLNLVFMMGTGIMGFFFVLLIEHVYLLNKSRCVSGKKRGESPAIQEEEEEEEEDDSDVVAERVRVMSGKAEGSPVCITGLSKRYPKKGSLGLCGKKRNKAVDNLCVGINAGECFGLLGVNGAGKTTVFKMLTGKTWISDGDALFSGLSVKTDLNNVRQKMGYCPQFDALHGLLTGKEQLTFYARLRGIEEKDIEEVVSWALKHMHLRAYASQRTQTYSGGNKRKLSTAIALIGNPSVVLLDEPTTGMDPKARRFLWNRITEVVKEKRCVILTSHSMEECETLCNRVAIMVLGKMKCLGSVQHLKNKFGEGYTLSMILRETSDSCVDMVSQFVQKEFPGAVLKERHRGMVEFRLPTEGVKLPRVFAVVQEAKEQLKLEDYALSQTTLDQVFISLAEPPNTAESDSPSKNSSSDIPTTLDKDHP